MGHGHHTHRPVPIRPMIGYTTTNAKVPLLVDEYKCIFEKQTEFQKVQIYESPNDNVDKKDKRLVLDGELQFSTLDERTYHESLIHVPMSYNYGKVLKVLVIGGGDGCALRELLKYEKIEKIDLVEIDKEIIEICKVYLDEMSCARAWSDKRVNVIIDDGYEWVHKNYNNYKYDLIVLDLTEETKLNVSLNGSRFWNEILFMVNDRNNGILVRNGKHPNIQQFYNSNHSNTNEIYINYYQTFIQSFGGQYAFTMVSFHMINMSTSPIDLSNVRLLLNESLNLDFTYPPVPQNLNQCCLVL